MVEDAGADIVDINFGCPVRKVTKTGAGRDAARGSRSRLPDRRGRRRRGRRAGDGEDAPRARGRLARRARRGPAPRRGGRRGADPAPALGEADVHGHGRPLAHRRAGRARRRAGDRVGRRHLPRARPALLDETGCAAVMVGRAAQGNPWARRRDRGDGRRAGREEVVAELVLFMRATVRELGEQRATGFLKKFYGWYLGRGRFPKPFKQELVQLAVARGGGGAAVRGGARRREVLARLEGELPAETTCSSTSRSRSTAAARAHRHAGITQVMAVATGERRIVSVLVADVVGSTAIGEQLGPERSKFLIDEVMRIMTEQVRRFDGTVAQLIGDELLALFGAPVAHEDDSERAVRAALAIQRALAQYAHEVEAAYGVELAVRIGVNTGPGRHRPSTATATTAATRTTRSATPSTSPPASRSIADGGGVVVGPTTKRADRGARSSSRRWARRTSRAWAEPLETFRVTRAARVEPVAAQPPLVGRDFELTVLERTMDALVEGRGAIVSIMGEPGIGKTRLVWEVRDRYRDRVRFIEARGVSYAQTFPYWPIRDLLREWLGVGASTPGGARPPRAEGRARARCFGKDEADEAYPFLASLLGLTLEPEAQSQRSASSTARASSQRRPSRSSSSSSASSPRSSRSASSSRTCTGPTTRRSSSSSRCSASPTRPPSRSSSSTAPSASTARGGSASARASATRTATGRSSCARSPPTPRACSSPHAAEGELPESVVELLAERSGGNPFFLEEALRDLIERGALAPPERRLAARRRRRRAGDPGRSCRGRSRRGSTASTRRRARCSRSRP